MLSGLRSSIARFGRSQRVRHFRLSREEYLVEHEKSLDPSYWGQVATRGLDWFKPFDKVLDDSNPPFYKWFVGGELNLAHNCVDRWVERGYGDQVAIIYDSPVTNHQVKKITYAQLQKDVAKFAGVLASKGVKKGDKVIIYMPMIPESLVAMLAVVRLGAIHSVVFGGFGSKELAVRIDHAKPKAIISASHGVEPTHIVPYGPLLESAIAMAEHKPDVTILKYRDQAPPERMSMEHDCWDDVMSNDKLASPHDCVPVGASDPSYILYTSGTTGQPKGVLRDTGGYATSLKHNMKYFMDVEEHETYWAASDIGWVVGASFLVYGPLLHGCTTILFEGKPVIPNPGVYWRVVQDHRVNAMFTAPTALRAIAKLDPQLKHLKEHDISSLRTMFVAGERCDPPTLNFFSKHLQIPIVDNYWQTEIGFPALGMQFKDVGTKSGSAGLPCFGFNFNILPPSTTMEGQVGNGNDDDNKKLGDVAIELPLPPGTLLTLYEADERFKSTYLKQHPGYYHSGDSGFVDEDGYYSIMARVDDVINVAAHRLSTGEMEEVLIGHPDVAEAAVIGPHDDLKGQVPLGFIVLKSSQEQKDPAEIEKEVVALVRSQIGAVAAFHHVFVVDALPKTRSGKILRAIMLKIANEQEYIVPGTIEDLSVIDSIERVIQERWVSKRKKVN